MHSSKYLAKAFTLVELIVVISVLGVLATIAFTQISNVTLSARNSTRMTNLQSISSSLNLYIATNGVYPIPDNKTDILYNGSIIGYQGYIKDTAARILKLSANTSQDPLNTSSYFSYATNTSRTDAQLLGFLEKDTSTGLKAVPTTFASDELNTKTPYSKGEELWILYTSGTTTPLSGTGVDVSTTTNPYTAYYNSNDSLTGTWNILQNLFISYSYGAGYGSPATDDCPTGFIPVPWNKDFNQPGFCVAKYEMKQAVGDAGSYTYSGSWLSHGNRVSSYCLTSSCNSTGVTRGFTNPVISKADGYPITFITQYNAIEACKAMGVGYHLITNNEWMTLSRNIEKTASNWSTGIVGSGYLYSGHNDALPNNAIMADANDSLWYANTGDSSGNQKRTLMLSNGSVIWDLAGNAYEHVNKANTIDGKNYTTWQVVLTCSNPTATSEWSTCGENDKFTQGSDNIAYDSSKGVGGVFHSQGMPDNIFLRWGGWGGTIYSGIFMLHIRGMITSLDGSVGFRCAK